MTSPTTNPDPWFEKMIAECLAGLYLLNLDGCPAADTVGKTTRFWLNLLWTNPRVRWHQEADSDRIRAAFRSIASTGKRWPTPAVFWDHLPDRAKPKASHTLMDPHWGREREREALWHRDRWLESLGLNIAGEPLDGAR